MYSRRRVFVGLAVLILDLLRLCHIRLLWADEDYHLAAALNMLHGKLPYRDFWYDKPPLAGLYYLLIGGHAGWPLRLLDSVYVLLVCFLIFRLARAFWSEAEGCIAAVLLAFFLAFDMPSATIGFAVDALMMAPNIAAMYSAYKGRPLAAGIWSAIAFLVNPKGVFVLAAASTWLLGSLVPLILGFLAPLAAAAGIASLAGFWTGYCEQVWRWGWTYAGQSPITHPLQTAVTRTAGWLGFHAALAGGAVVCFIADARRHRMMLLSWIIISCAAVCLGNRFEPRYYLQVLPPMVVAGSRGIVVCWRQRRTLTALLLFVVLLVPFLHFGFHYATLAYDNLCGQRPHWTDVQLDLDSQKAAQLIRQAVLRGDTLFVWGYRPDIYVYTRLTSDSRFWDSQPLTGVPADRHLHASKPISNQGTAQNRRELAQSSPTWIVDGLGLLNPNLQLGEYAELRPWLGKYRLFGKTRFCTIYRRIDASVR